MLMFSYSWCIILLLFVNIEGELCMRTFVATVRLTNGLHQPVRVRADSQLAARAMIESMFGSGCILQGPWSIAD
jgi:hypothetical protein